MREKYSHRYLAPAALAATVFFGALWGMSSEPSAQEKADNKDVPALQIAAAARGVVDIEGGMMRITAPRDGKVIRVDGLEGASVKPGDTLAELDSQQEELAEKIADEEFAQTKNQYHVLQLKEKGAAKQLERLRRASSGKAISDQALDEALDAHAILLVELQNAASAIKVAQLRLEVTRRERRLRVITVPISGLIVRQAIRVGETVSAQAMTEMFTVLPDAPRVVRAEIPEQFLNAVRVGMPVEILSENSTKATASGRISRLSPVLSQSKSPEVAGERSDIRTANCVIAVDPRASLLVGQRVIVRVRQ